MKNERMDEFDAAMIEAGYGKPDRNFSGDGYLYQRDDDRYVGWKLAIDAADKPTGAASHDSDWIQNPPHILETGMNTRAAFEHWFSDGGISKKAIERDGDGYKLMAAHSAWKAWQAAVDAAIAIIADDSLAISFQSMAQYRSALIAKLRNKSRELQAEKAAGKTHYADDDTIAYIARLERQRDELAEALMAYPTHGEHFLEHLDATELRNAALAKIRSDKA